MYYPHLSKVSSGVFSIAFLSFCDNCQSVQHVSFSQTAFKYAFYSKSLNRFWASIFYGRPDFNDFMSIFESYRLSPSDLTRCPKSGITLRKINSNWGGNRKKPIV